MKWRLRNPGTTMAILALVVLVAGRLFGLPVGWVLLVSFILLMAGATMVNGTYVLRRLFIVIPTVVIVTAFTFWLQNSRGDTRDLAFIILGPGATPQAVDDVIQEFHLEEPMHTRYLLWLSDAVRGDLGRSAIQGQDVATAIKNAVPVTLLLMLYAQLLALLIAVPAGIYAAYRANRRGDRVASTAALAATSIPNFVLAILLVLFLALGGFKIGPVTFGGSLFPASRYEAFGDGIFTHFKHMALPTIALALGLAATYMRVLRSDMISTLQDNFIITAKAKGVSDRRILFAHALRPSSFTLITLFGITTGTLIGGALIVETIFALPGLGTTLFTAIFSKDFLVVQGVVVVVAVGFVLINFLVDLLYAVIDPRVRHVRA